MYTGLSWVHWDATHTGTGLALSVLFHVVGREQFAGAEGQQVAPSPPRASPGLACFLVQQRLAAAPGRLLCQKACRYVTDIEYIKHYCLTMPHTNHLFL